MSGLYYILHDAPVFVKLGSETPNLSDVISARTWKVLDQLDRYWDDDGNMPLNMPWVGSDDWIELRKLVDSL